MTNAAGTLAFQVARLANGTCWILSSALEKESKAEIIASPRVTTANQKPALIEQGTEIPMWSPLPAGDLGHLKEGGTEPSKVTPQITPDNRVILDLTVTQDTKGKPCRPEPGMRCPSTPSPSPPRCWSTTVKLGAWRHLSTDHQE